MKNLIYIFLLFISSIFGIKSFAQSIPVGLPIYDEYYRRAQLLGDLDAFASFTNRPIFPPATYGTDIFDPDSTMYWNRVSNFDGLWEFSNGTGIVQLLPISFLSQYNSHHPEGINDGTMIPARGFQTQISAGVYIKYGPLSIQLRPEFVNAQNLAFDGFPKNYTSATGIEFPSSQFRNRIDLPERFGDNAYKKAFWGQSSIRLTAGSISLGLSNENLWWGPGYRNSLLMTNSASGFKHLTLNTVKPIKTYIGSFEGQMIAGKLEGSGYTENLPDDWRYLNGMVVSYQPKWIPSLFLGATRSFQVYSVDMGTSLGDYLPVFSFLSKSGGGTNEEVNTQRKDQRISIFGRWLFLEVNSEIYFEYGREDHSWDLRDFLLEPSHTVAYVLGLRKLFRLNRQNKTYIQFIGEITNMALNQITVNRGGSGMADVNWYTNGDVIHGYTNDGQLLGAGIGPGSNLQTIDISWTQSLKQIGIQVERYVHNNDFWYNTIKDFRSNWVDLSATAYASWDYHNLLFTLKLKYSSSYNYEWLYEPTYEGTPTYWMPGKNTGNIHGQFGIMYRF